MTSTRSPSQSRQLSPKTTTATSKLLSKVPAKNNTDQRNAHRCNCPARDRQRDHVIPLAGHQDTLHVLGVLLDHDQRREGDDVSDQEGDCSKGRHDVHPARLATSASSSTFSVTSDSTFRWPGGSCLPASTTLDSFTWSGSSRTLPCWSLRGVQRRGRQ